MVSSAIQMSGSVVSLRMKKSKWAPWPVSAREPWDGGDGGHDAGGLLVIAGHEQGGLAGEVREGPAAHAEAAAATGPGRRRSRPRCCTG